MKSIKIGFVFAQLLCLFTFCSDIYALPGDLDATFDLDGKTTTNIGSHDIGMDIAVQADGKIVAIGHSSGGIDEATNDFSLVRYNADGSLDTGFGTGGKVFFPENGDQEAASLLIQPDGKIVVVGRERLTASGPFHLAVYRYNADGSPDPTFGTNGKIVHAVQENGYGSDAALQPDGKIVITGYVTSNLGNLIVWRLNTNGSLDTDFNSVGYFISFSRVEGTAVAVQTDGKIVVGASELGGGSYGYWLRLNSNGTYEDGSFYMSNFVVADVALQTDGKIVFSGYISQGGNRDFAVARFNSDRTLDKSFGVAGRNTVFWGASSLTNAASLFIQPDGRIVVGGHAWFGTRRFALARLNSNGFLDVGFGNGGKVVPQILGGEEQINGIARQADGKIVVVGSTNNAGSRDFAVARFEGGASNTLPNRTPFDYDGDGRADMSVFRPSTNIWYLLNSRNASFSAPQFGGTGDILAPADYDGDGRTEIGIYRPASGEWWYLSTASNTIVSFFYGASGCIPRPSDFDGDGKADAVLYQPSTGRWLRRGSTGVTSTINFGVAEDQPLVGDFDGDGKSDPAIFRPSTGDWWYAASASNNQHSVVHWGAADDIPTPADVDADGKTDFVVYRPSNGGWYILRSGEQNYTILQFGTSEDKPVMADYDGDGKADLAVFRPSTGTWYLLQTTAGFGAVQWGTAGDIPTENAFLP